MSNDKPKKTAQPPCPICKTIMGADDNDVYECIICQTPITYVLVNGNLQVYTNQSEKE